MRSQRAKSTDAVRLFYELSSVLSKVETYRMASEQIDIEDIDQGTFSAHFLHDVSGERLVIINIQSRDISENLISV